MEVTVWVEGFPRIVCGLTDTSTCHDVVVALASATGRTGRFTLIEKWRESERLLAPSERPLRVLHKWGEYSGDVQFILKHSDTRSKVTSQRTRRTDRFNHNFSPHPPKGGSRCVKRSLTFSGGHGVPFPQGHDSLESLEDACSVTSDSRSSLSPYASFECPPREVAGYTGNSLVGSLDRKRPGSSTAEPRSVGQGQRNQSMFSSLERRVKRTPPVQDVRPLVVNRTLPVHSVKPQSVQGTKPAVQNVQPQTQTQPVEYVHVEKPSVHAGNVSQPSHVHIHHVKSDRPVVQGVHRVQSDRPSVQGVHKTQTEKTPSVDNKPPVATDQNKNLITKSSDDRATPGEDQSQKSHLVRMVNNQQEKVRQQQSSLKLLETEIIFWEQRESEQKRRQEADLAETEELRKTDGQLQGELEELELVSWEEKLMIERKQTESLESQMNRLRDQLKEREELKQDRQKEAENLESEVKDEETEQEAERVRREAEHKEKEKRLQAEIDKLTKEMEAHEASDRALSNSLQDLIKQETDIKADVVDRQAQIDQLEEKVRQANMDTFGAAADKLPPSSLGLPFNRSSSARPVGGTRRLLTSQRLKDSVATSRNPHGLWV